MNKASLIFRNLWYFRKPYLAIAAGMLVSIAVLTGALIIGDSVRFSLQKLTDQRLGKIRFAVESGDRLFRDSLASEISSKCKATVAPVLQSNGIAINTNTTQVINNIKIYGINDKFRDLFTENCEIPEADEAVISENTALRLGLKSGDEFLLKIRIPDKIPQNAPFVSETLNSVSIRLKVKSIATNISFGRFSLKSNQAAPFNVFISLKQMAAKLKMNGNANVLLAENSGSCSFSASKLDSLLKLCWKPLDAGIKISPLNNNNTLEITSERIFLDSSLSATLVQAIDNPSAVLGYLANSISTKTNSAPYSFIVAADSGFLNTNLKENEILINDWLAADLAIKAGDSIWLTYYIMGPMRTLKEETSVFLLKSTLPIKNPVWDPGLMPKFPGVNEAGNCRDWETGVPINLKKIREKDEDYWRMFRGTPKAFISLKAGQRIWKNPFGKLTAIRFSEKRNSISSLEKLWMKKLKPASFKLLFSPVYDEGLASAKNSTDFGGLFISLSFFLILAGLILIGMLFSLHARSRLKEAGILTSLGFRKRQIIKLFLAEVLIVSVVAGICGAFSGIIYNKLLIAGLNTIWQDAVRTSTLETFISLQTLITGSFTGIVLSIIVILFVLVKNLRLSVSVLLRNSLNYSLVRLSKGLLFAILSSAFILSSLLLLIYLLFISKTDNPLLFMVAGGLLLAGLLAGTYYFLRKLQNITPSGFPDFMILVRKNASINPGRTMGIITLLALGTFSIMITGANHRSFYGSENNAKSGSGGVLFWGETVIPVAYNLNTPFGKKKFSINDEPAFKDVHFIQIPQLSGSDASCLNLNQVKQPAVLGINSDLFDKEGMFTFTAVDDSVDRKHPWRALKTAVSADLIPAFADQTVISWGLRKKIGDTLLYHDESGRILKLKLIGGLDNSIFQGNILISDSLFRIHYPSYGSSTIFLVQGPYSRRDTISQRLQYLFQDQGLVLTAASQRLAEFNSVQNTYLSVFMLLGGLGVILGTIGLGFFLLRNTQERQAELSIYLAIGFRKNFIRLMLITENMLILTAGLGFGVLAALTSIIPSFVSPAFEFPAVLLLIIGLLIFASGTLASILPVFGQKHMFWKPMPE